MERRTHPEGDPLGGEQRAVNDNDDDEEEEGVESEGDDDDDGMDGGEFFPVPFDVNLMAEVAAAEAADRRELERAQMDLGIVNLPSAAGLAPAVRYLQRFQHRGPHHRRPRWDDLIVIVPYSVFADLAARRQGHHLRDFVTEVGRLHWVRSIHLNLEGRLPALWGGGEGESSRRSTNGSGDRPVARELDRLFGTVLPRHPSLAQISFESTRLPIRCLELFTEGIASTPTSTLRKLQFESSPLGAEGGRLLGSMLGSATLALEELSLWRCELGSDGLRHVCEGVARLGTLHVIEPHLEIQPGTIVAAAAGSPGPNLTALLVESGSWSREAFAELVAALRTNASLARVHVSRQQGTFEDAKNLVHDLLGAHNFTLSSFRVDPPLAMEHDQLALDGLLERNGRVKFVHKALTQRDYRVPCRALWPLYLQEIRPFPALIYRFVRRGNLETFVDSRKDTATASRKRSHDQF